MTSFIEYIGPSLYILHVHVHVHMHCDCKLSGADRFRYEHVIVINVYSAPVSLAFVVNFTFPNYYFIT